MTFILDNREGSYQLANIEPIRSLLPQCQECRGYGKHVEHPSTYAGSNRATFTDCPACRATGRQLGRITTSSGTGGPDVLIVGNGPTATGSLLVAVEVKSVRDLITSADTGRLQAQGDGQLDAMLTSYQQSWLLWYGTVRRSQDGKIEEPSGRGSNGHCLWRPFTKTGDPSGRPLPYTYLANLLLSVARLGIHVHHVANERDAAAWLGDLYAYWTKPWDEHGFEATFSAAPRFPRVMTDKETGKPVPVDVLERARRVYDRYPDMGRVHSIAAAKHFPSVRAMANATESEWREVPGIGPVIASALFKAFNA